MAKSEVTIADVDQAEAALLDAKKKRLWSKDPDRYQELMEALAEKRTAWRVQEEKAQRRVGLVSTEED